ncbi:sugar phosphate isomerase/epimerase [Candidatus Pelagibacter bacterium]|nr:sugar phosphate isomerase/epimerase [Candidatus Pelagibacter bacterium]|tara:strand:+ start:1321 stop:2232 length:912 start_codon:yes stop_codon:yes gene_type:complete
MKYNLGINTGFAVNRFCEPKELFNFISNDLELNNVQLSADLISPFYEKKLLKNQIKKYKSEINKNSINISSLFTGAFTRLNHLAHSDTEIQNFWINWFKTFVNISSELECDTIGSHFGIFSYKDNNNLKLRKTRRKQNIENWHIIGEYAKKQGIKVIMWEPMSISREQGETILECKKLQKDVNKSAPIPFKLCMDVDHGELTSKNKNDTDPYYWLSTFAKDIKAVHLKQSLKDKGGHWPFTNKYNKLGKIFPNKVIKALKDNGCEETDLILELSFRERNPIDDTALADIKESVHFWKKNNFVN